MDRIAYYIKQLVLYFAVVYLKYWRKASFKICLVPPWWNSVFWICFLLRSHCIIDNFLRGRRLDTFWVICLCQSELLYFKMLMCKMCNLKIKLQTLLHRCSPFVAVCDYELNSLFGESKSIQLVQVYEFSWFWIVLLFYYEKMNTITYIIVNMADIIVHYAQN